MVRQRGFVSESTIIIFKHNIHMKSSMEKSPKPAIKAVVFDAFGTVCHIRNRQSPFRKIAMNYPDRHAASRIAMTKPLGLAAFESYMNPPGNINRIAQLERCLHDELMSITLFPEVPRVLDALKKRSLKLAIASNLAQPYAVPVRALLPIEMDTYAWSFDVGAMKPDREIFAWTGNALGCKPHEMLMVGDTMNDDYDGATACGLHALHLDRSEHLTGGHVVHTLDGVLDWLDR